MRADLLVALVEVDSQHLSDFAAGRQLERLPIVRVAGDDQPRGEGDAPRGALLHHAVGVGEASCQRLLAEHRPNARLRRRNDCIRVRLDRQDRRRNVDIFLGQHLLVARVAGRSKPLAEECQVLRIGVRDGRHLRARVQMIPPRVVRSLPSSPDDADAVDRFGCHGMPPFPRTYHLAPIL